MWKWLREHLAWRFSLRRLVIATVFLGAVVGLNLRKIGPEYPLMAIKDQSENDIWAPYYYGWPFPCMQGLEQIESTEGFRCIAAFELPLTHQTYRLQGFLPVSPKEELFIVNAILDALVALIPLFLILFLQVPRRKAPEQAK